MAYVTESKGHVRKLSQDRFSIPCHWAYPGYGPSVTEMHVWDTDHVVQTGWRGPKSHEAPDSFSAGFQDRLFEGGTWAGRNRDYLTVERARLATTPSPLVRSPSIPVHERDVLKTKALGTGGILTRVETSSQRYQDLVWIIDASSSSGRLPGGALPTLPTDIVLELRDECASRMAAARPTKPLAGLGQFMAELRDFPRLLSGLADIHKLISQGKHPGAGSQYLGYQFGWAPMISDIRKCAEVIAKGTGPLEQFLRDSGELVSRRVRTSSHILADEPFLPDRQHFRSPRTPAGYNALIDPQSSFKVDRVQATGFGLYEYFVGDPTGALASMPAYAERAQKLLGTDLNASVLWELTPWSWMIDWFVDVGGLLAFQTDVSDYALALRRGGWTYKHQSQRLVHGRFHYRGDEWYKVWPVNISRTKRYAALSPGGIDVDWSALSPFQLSILAALGLSSKNW